MNIGKEGIVVSTDIMASKPYFIASTLRRIVQHYTNTYYTYNTALILMLYYNISFFFRFSPSKDFGVDIAFVQSLVGKSTFAETSADKAYCTIILLILYKIV